MDDVRFPSPASNFEEGHLWIKENVKQETATTVVSSLGTKLSYGDAAASLIARTATTVRRCHSSVSAVITSAWRGMKRKASASCALRSTTQSIFSGNCRDYNGGASESALAKPCAVLTQKGFPHDKIDGQTNKAAT